MSCVSDFKAAPLSVEKLLKVATSMLSFSPCASAEFKSPVPFFNYQSCHVDPSVMIAQSCMAYGPHIEIVYALSNRHGKYVMGKLSGYRDVERNESATI